MAGLASLVASVVSGSSATFISLIGFSEYLSLLPIVNLDYTPGMVKFFHGISGMNFQMLSIGNYLDFLRFGVSAEEKEKRFTNAGFDTSSLILGAADYFLTVVLTVVFMLIFHFLNRILFKRK